MLCSLCGCQTEGDVCADCGADLPNEKISSVEVSLETQAEEQQKKSSDE